VKTCAHCGKPFEPVRKTQIYCRAACSDSAWRARNREKVRERDRRWHENNREKVREKGRGWRENNRDKVREKDRRYRENNQGKERERKRLWHRRQQLKKQGALNRLALNRERLKDD
jgi:hypothetical protein